MDGFGNKRSLTLVIATDSGVGQIFWTPILIIGLIKKCNKKKNKITKLKTK